MTPFGDQNKEPQKSNDASFLNRQPEKAAEEVKKPEGDGGKKQEGAVDPAAGAPEKYTDFKLPEGYTLDGETDKAAQAVFKELGLNQEQAQKLVDLYAKNGISAAEAPYKLWAQTQKDWVADIENRFGSKAENMRTDINKAIDAAITSPKLRSAFRQALDLTGFGSNPDAFEALSIFAKPFLEGTPVKGGGPTKESQKAPEAPNRPSAAEAIYPHLIPNRGGT